MEALTEAKQRLREWLETAESGYEVEADLAHVMETLGHRYASLMQPYPDDEESALRMSLLPGIRFNAEGLYRYLQQRDAGKVAT
jgi:hypothetical protein